MSTTDDLERRTLAERARELAREPVAETPASELLEIVEFDLGCERYGFELGQVCEVCLLRALTPVPCTPPFIAGVINLRGEIRTIIDLKKLFDLPASGLSDSNQIILLEQDGRVLGILADALRGVRALRLDELQPALPTLTGIRADYLRGVTGERLVVLDAARILSDPRIVVDEEVET